MKTDEVKNIKTIIFDWAGIFCTPGEPFTHPDLQKQTGLTVDEMGAKTRDIQDKYYCGKISTEEFWNNVIAALSVTDLTGKDLGDAYRASYTLYPGMLERAGQLRSEHNVALLSNLTEIMMRHIIETHHIERYFDELFFSNTIGFMKPDSEAYNIVLRKMDAKPEESLFIDDSQKNVDAAQKLGMHAFQFEGGSPELLDARLAEFGITI
jgi:putative hydrolase of the HAD superfamily